jgi:hypothetical protein
MTEPIVLQLRLGLLRVGFIAQRLPFKRIHSGESTWQDDRNNTLNYQQMNVLAQIRDLMRARAFHPFVITTGHTRELSGDQLRGGRKPEVSLIKRGIKLDRSITWEAKCLI